MDTRERVGRGVAVGFGLLALGITGLGLVVTYGVAEEYSGGTGLSLLPVVLLLAGAAGVLATWSWPEARAGVRVGVPVLLAVVGGLGWLSADQLGDRAHEQRLVSGSNSFVCNGPNAEIQVDERVDETFAELPRRSPIYGPVEGSRTGCTAAVSGTGAESFAAYADAFRDLEGWTVTVDRPDRFVMQRDGVRVAMRLGGAPDQLAMIEVSTIVQDS